MNMLSYSLRVLVSILVISNVLSAPCSVEVDFECKASTYGKVTHCYDIPAITKPEDCIKDINFIYNVKNTGNVEQTIESVARTRFAETVFVAPMEDTIKAGLNTLAVESLTSYDLCANQRKEINTVVTVKSSNSGDVCENAYMEKFTLNLKCNIQLTIKSCMYDSIEDCSFPGSCDSILLPTSVNGCKKLIKYSYTLENVGPVPEQIFHLSSTLGGDLLQKGIPQNSRTLDVGAKIDVEDIVEINVCENVGTQISNVVTVAADTSPIALGTDCQDSQTYSFSIPTPSPSFIPSFIPSSYPSISNRPTKTPKTAKSSKSAPTNDSMPSCMPFYAPSSVPSMSFSPTKSSKSKKSQKSSKSSKLNEGEAPSASPSISSLPTVKKSGSDQISSLSTNGRDPTNEVICEEITKGNKLTFSYSADVVSEERSLQMDIYVDSEANLLTVEKNLKKVATNAIMTTMYGCSDNTSSNAVRNLQNGIISAVALKDLIREKNPSSSSCPDSMTDNILCVSYKVLMEVSFEKNDRMDEEDISVATFALLKREEQNIMRKMNSQLKGIKIHQPSTDDSTIDGTTIGIIAIGGAIFVVVIVFSGVYVMKRNDQVESLQTATPLFTKNDEFFNEPDDINSDTWFEPEVNVFTNEYLQPRWYTDHNRESHIRGKGLEKPARSIHDASDETQNMKGTLKTCKDIWHSCDVLSKASNTPSTSQTVNSTSLEYQKSKDDKLRSPNSLIPKGIPKSINYS